MIINSRLRTFIDNKLRTYYGVEEANLLLLAQCWGDAITSYDASLKVQIAEAVKALLGFSFNRVGLDC